MRMPGLRTAGILLAGFAGAGLILERFRSRRVRVQFRRDRCLASGGFRVQRRTLRRRFKTRRDNSTRANYSGAI